MFLVMFRGKGVLECVHTEKLSSIKGGSGYLVVIFASVYEKLSSIKGGSGYSVVIFVSVYGLWGAGVRIYRKLTSESREAH